MRVIDVDKSREWQRQDRAKKNIKAPNKIQCLICGLWYRKVGCHIYQIHGMSTRTYREKFNLEVKRGLLTEQEREPLRRNVMSNGTVENLKKGRKFWFEKGDKRAGNYTRSPITIARLKTLKVMNMRKNK